jgi:hypothetical protein
MPKRSSFIVVGWLKMLDEDGELMSKRIDRGSFLNWFGRWSLVVKVLVGRRRKNVWVVIRQSQCAHSARQLLMGRLL